MLTNFLKLLSLFNRHPSPFTLLSFIFFFCFAGSLSAQNTQGSERIEIVNVDSSIYDKPKYGNVRVLYGHVEFKHQNALMNCDSAYQYLDSNIMHAFGNVKINQGDTVTLTGKRLFYNGDNQLAQVFENVVLTDRKMVLRANRLDYNMKTDVASYTDSAKITDGDNQLTSRAGYYQSKTKELLFKKNVILTNPRYTMTCDTLRYNTLNHTAYFLSPTYIISKENTIYTERGWYNTDKENCYLDKSSYLLTKTQQLRGDSLLYNRKTGIGRGFRNVSITDTVNKVIISGDYAEHQEISDSSFVTGRTMLTQIFETDSLFMHSDTLYAVPDTAAPPDAKGGRKKMLLAYHHVKMYKSDMQGKCDSMVYNFSDSTIRMYTAPVLWSGLNQLTADTVIIQTANGQIDKVYLNSASFIASRADSLQQGIVDSLKFNQIRGKRMTGYFMKNKLDHIFVEGNGQTIYYGKNSKDKTIGVNRADCSDLMIYIKDNKVKSLTLIKEPSATFYPSKELPTSELRLKGFNWQITKKPLSKTDIFQH